MAIKVLENITINRFGLTLQNLILSFKGTYRLHYQIENDSRVYIASSNLNYYVNREKEPLWVEPCSFVIPENFLNTNINEYMYNMIKTRYEHFENL